MSDDAKQEVNPIEQTRAQLQAFIQQREQVKAQFEQLSGAIFACEQLLIQMLPKPELPTDNNGANDGETNGQGEGESPQE